MEKEQFYSSNNLVGKGSITFDRGLMEDERPKPGYVATVAIPNTGVNKPLVTTTVVKPSVINTDVLKPSIQNTGVYVKPVTPVSTAIVEPAKATNVLILSPNVPGGIKTENPSPITDELKKIAAASKASIQGAIAKGVNTVIEPTQKAIAQGADTGNKLASLGLPSPLIIGGMILAVIVFYFLARKK
jgi:hypothetical protein